MNAEDIQTLAQAIRELNQPAAPTVTLKLPEFWTDDPEVWFARVESQFNTKGVNVDSSKFDPIVSALDNAAASEVKNILTDPPAQNKYEALKNALLAAFSKTQAEKDSELLNLSGLGDKKPTALLRKIRSLNSDAETLRRALFLAQLPTDVRGVLAGQQFTTLEALAEAADRVVEARQPNKHSQASFAISKKGASSRQTQVSTESNICFFHAKYGTLARSCKPGCIFADLPRAKVETAFNPTRTSENFKAGR